ncbi:hypothetical protein CAAN3_17S01750 [[Candida] anglica]
MSKSQRGLSYVLGDSNNNENHILPINAAQYSQTTRKLYTAGRDGAVKIWTPSQVTFPVSHSNSFQFTSGIEQVEDQSLDEQMLKLETSICSSKLGYMTPTTNDYTVSNSYNVHFDWVNDLSLVNNNMGLVSCSSDLSLKYIQLDNEDEDLQSNSNFSSKVHKFYNVHTDYVKKLSSVANENKIVSAGLDGKIVIWDLNTLNEVAQFENKASNSTSVPCSVYSLASVDTNLIAAGGPNNTINLFDKRSSFVKKLIGHQDNIRCLMMNDNFILSGSSDTTIKLWDLRNHKVLQTFEIHDDAVWSLASAGNNSNFNSFYSGDRCGNIIKTDLSYLSANNSKRDQSEFFSGYETYSSTDKFFIDEKLGISTFVAKADSGIISLCVEGGSGLDIASDDCAVFASNSMSFDRYHVPDTVNLSRYQFLRSCAEYNNGMADDTSDVGNAPEANDLNSDFYDLVSHLSMDSHVDIQSSISAANNNYPLSIHNIDGEIAIDDDYEYYSMFLSINGGPSQEFVSEVDDTEDGDSIDNNEDGASIYKSKIDILLNPIPSDHITMVPFNKSPFDRFPISLKSIIAKRLFNNKRHMVVLYMNGDIKIWDLFICRELKSFPNEEDFQNQSKLIEKRTKYMDDIFNQYQTMDTLNNWCEVEIKAGKLLVIIRESTFDNVRIYYDELISNYPFLDYTHSDNVEGKKNSKVKVTFDDRFYLSRIFLNSIFHQYALFEWEFDNQLRQELKTIKSKNLGKKISGLSNSSIHTNDEELNEESNLNNNTSSSTLKRIKMFGRKSSKTSISQAQQQQQQKQSASLTASPVVSASNSMLDSSNNSLNGVSTDVGEMISFIPEEISKQNNSFNYDDSIMKLLQINKLKYREKYNTSKTKVVDSLLNIYSNDPMYESKNRIIHPSAPVDESKLIFDVYKPLIYPKRFPQNLLIIISEHSSELGNLRDLCSFQFEDINKLQFGDPNVNKELINNLRLYLPKWIGQPILYDFFPTKEGPKISFQLVEYDYSQLPNTKKIGGRVGKRIKKLPISESCIKLSSHHMLRVGKILSYLTEKFESRTSEMKDHEPATKWLVLECKGEVLANNLTLQTIKTKLWKSSADITLTFRRKFDDE